MNEHETGDPTIKDLCRLFFSVVGYGRGKRFFREISSVTCCRKNNGIDMTVMIVMPTYNEAAASAT
jgi:hypothetical protein